MENSESGINDKDRLIVNNIEDGLVGNVRVLKQELSMLIAFTQGSVPPTPQTQGNLKVNRKMSMPVISCPGYGRRYTNSRTRMSRETTTLKSRSEFTCLYCTCGLVPPIEEHYHYWKSVLFE